MGRCIAWFDTGTHQSLLRAANFVDAIEECVVTIIAGQRRLPGGWGLLTTSNPAGFQLMANSFDIEIDKAWAGKFKLSIGYTDIYMDFDDCLVLADQINTQAVSFLYQCVNNGVLIHLSKKDIESLQFAYDNFASGQITFN